VPKKATSSKRQPKGVTGDAGRVTRKTKPPYRRKPPKPEGVASALCADSIEPQARHYNVSPTPISDLRSPKIIAPSHFELREDGSIQKIKGSATVPVAPFGVPPNGTSEDVSGETPNTAGGTPALPQLIFRSDNPFIRLYHGNSLELLDAIAAKYPDGRFDAIFADPPYFLPAGP
jgi:hypothetical protein